MTKHSMVAQIAKRMNLHHRVIRFSLIFDSGLHTLWVDGFRPQGMGGIRWQRFRFGRALKRFRIRAANVGFATRSRP